MISQFVVLIGKNALRATVVELWHSQAACTPVCPLQAFHLFSVILGAQFLPFITASSMLIPSNLLQIDETYTKHTTYVSRMR